MVNLNENIFEAEDDSELYYSKSEIELLELTKDFCELSNSTKQGTCFRQFFSDHVEASFVNKIVNYPNILDLKLFTNNTPPLMMPKKKIKSCNKEFPSLFRNYSRRLYKNIYNNIELQLQNTNYSISKVFAHSESMIYKLINSSGVKGGGYRGFYCSGIELYNNLTDTLEMYYRINEPFLDNEHLLEKSFISLINENRSFLRKQNKANNHQVVMLSEDVISKIIYLFIMQLLVNNIKAHHSFFAYNDYNDIQVSNLLSIYSNSVENKLYGGTIDGEGTEINHLDIVKNGNIKRLFKSYSDFETNDLTGSAYRIDYITLPCTQPKKMVVSKGTLTTEELIAKYGSVAIIDAMQGLEESINFRTLDFSSIAHVRFVQNNSFINSAEIQIKSNILSILHDIIDIGMDQSYCIDGSILVSPVIVDKEHINLSL